MKHRWRRRFCVLLLLFLAGSLWAGRYWLEVSEYTLSSARLPSAFDGFRVVQLSDLHGLEFGPDNARLVEQVQTLRPDLIALTGDFIETAEDIPVTETLIRALADIAPVYVCSGNHDWASGAAGELRSAVTDAGGLWLSNDCRVFTRDGQSLIVAGVEDPNSYADMTRPDELTDAIALAYPEDFVLLLGHRNDWPETYPDLKADVILCGHGHGGVIRLPFVGGVLGTDHRLFPEYDGGLFSCGRYTMVVSRGLSGIHGLPRLWNRPDIVCLTLRCS